MINKKLIVSILLVGLVFLPAQLSAIIIGYLTDDPGLKTGMAVVISTASTPDQPKVERATPDTASKVVGITTSVENSLVVIASGKSQVYVETSDDVDALISDLNGNVSSGDSLSVSPLKGILMKADKSSDIVGIALENFSTASAKSYQYQNGKSSATTQVASLKIKFNSKNPENDRQASSLERLGKSIVGKDVSELRVAMALIVFILILIIEGSTLYGAIASSVISLGRNPLASGLIKHELLRLVMAVFAVLIVGLGAIYIILWV